MLNIFQKELRMSKIFVCIFLILAQISVFHALLTAQDAREHSCAICIETVNAYHRSNSASLSDACASLFPSEVCQELDFPSHPIIKESNLNESGVRLICQDIQKCSTPFARRKLSSTWTDDADGWDVKVSPGMGSRGYGYVRISLVTSRSLNESEKFVTVLSNSSMGTQNQSFPYSYSEPFQYRWTDKHLSTLVLSPSDLTGINLEENRTATFPITSTVQVANETLTIRIPPQGSGVRGVMIADPCISSEFLYCIYETRMEIGRKLSTFLNLAFGHEKQDLHYWQILGDNFYDLDGSITPNFYKKLSPAVKSALFSTVPGNHDFWIDADPSLFRPEDHLGHGFMQYFGQDTAAASLRKVNSSDNSSDTKEIPYDFSVEPDGVNSQALPPASNFFYYNQIGNVAFIGYSGAHSFEENRPLFEEACLWAKENEHSIFTVFLVGHWHRDGNGASFNGATPRTYNEMMGLSACRPIMQKLKYFMGHRHCNMMTQRHIGFMVGSQGMSEASSCYLMAYLEDFEESLVSSFWRLAFGVPFPFRIWLFSRSDTHSSENHYKTYRSDSNDDYDGDHDEDDMKKKQRMLKVTSESMTNRRHLRGSSIHKHSAGSVTVATRLSEIGEELFDITMKVIRFPVVVVRKCVRLAQQVSHMWSVQGGAFGVPIVDTTESGRLKVYYFSLAQDGMYDRYDEVTDCVRDRGISGCYHLAELWSDTPL